VKPVCFILFGSDYSGNVLQEMDPAFFACPTVSLLVAAGGALKPQRRMTASAESGDISDRGTAFRTIDQRARSGGVEIRGAGTLFFSGHNSSD
jgi:hypothetical protein